MNLVRCLMLGSFLLGVAGLGAEAGAGKKAQELIVGKWQMEKKEKSGDKEIVISLTMQFASDGKYKVTRKVGEPINKELTKEGKYKFLDDTTLEITPAGEGEKKERTKIEKLTATDLTLVSEKDSQGKTVTLELKRVK